MSIFCPKCDELILDDARCAACGWLRPAQGAHGGDTLWRVLLGAQFEPRPPPQAALAAGHICLVAGDGKLRALRVADGAAMWQHALPGRRFGHAVAGDAERLFVGTIDMRPLPEEISVLAALDGATGEPVWQIESDGHSFSNAVVDQALLAVCSSSGMLHGLDAASGTRLWSQRHAPWGRDCLATANGLLCAAGQAGLLAAFELASGRPLWHFQTDDWFTLRPAIGPQCVFALGAGRVLYALDSATGRCLWQQRGERGKGFLTPPAALGELLFVGSRVWLDGQKPGYAMLALRAADGSEVWRVPTPRPAAIAPLASGDHLLFGAANGSFYALAMADGALAWLRSTGQPLATQPCVAEDTVMCGLKDGTVLALRRQAASEPQQAPPATYEARGEHRQAARAYALAGDLLRAAQITRDRLQEPHRAARLFERAGAGKEAGALWEELGNLERAAAQYEAANAHGDRGRVLSLKGELLEAARAYEKAEMWLEAARQYERAGDRPSAATLYNLAGDPERARLIYRDLGDWERESETLIEFGRLAEAAELLARHGKLERAADLYDQADNWSEALALRLDLGHWQRAVELAVRIGAHEEEAIAREWLGQPARAAAAFERAAAKLLAAQEPDEQQVARLYERAAQLYAKVFDSANARACSKLVRRYRRLPDIVIRTGDLSPFSEYHWAVVPLSIANEGSGTALEIGVEVESDFFEGKRLTINGLRPQQVATPLLSVRAFKEQYGALPLQLTVTYKDEQGQRYEDRPRIEDLQIVPEKKTRLEDTGPRRPPQKFAAGYALIIGISQYAKVSDLPVQVGRDVRSLQAVLCESSQGGYLNERVHLLGDAAANLQAIRRRMNWLLENVQERHTVLFYFSGHGHRIETAANQGSVLCPYDFDPFRAPETAISESELMQWVARLKAQNVLLIFDCCYAGGMGQQSVGLGEGRPSSGLSATFYRHLGQGNGRVILASSSADESSLILPDMQHSLFTEHLLRALKGEVRTLYDDGYIRWLDMWRYIREQVPADASQQPRLWGDQGDFPIALKRGGR